MKSQNEVSEILEKAIKDIREGIQNNDKRGIINAMNSVEHDATVDLQLISDSLFEDWQEIAEEATEFLYS